MDAKRLARFFGHVEITDSCWEWRGTLSGSAKSYGEIRIDNKKRLAHRVAYEHFKGVIPPGLQIDHLCRNTRCVNPEHLDAVTPRVNLHRSNNFTGLNHRKTHCPQGHPYDEENTLVLKDGSRKCRICKKARERISQGAYYARHKEAILARRRNRRLRHHPQAPSTT